MRAKLLFLLFLIPLLFINHTQADTGVWIDGVEQGTTLRTLGDVDDTDIGNGKVLKYNTTTEKHEYAAESEGAPTDADYLVGTANGDLSAEIAVGTSPGGELGGTWPSPTVDSSIHDDEYIELTDNFVGDVTGTYGATDITESVLAVGGSDTIFPADPNADKYLMWDDDPGNLSWESIAGGGDVTGVGDVTSGAAFDGTQGTTLTFNNAGGDGTLIYDGTDFTFSKILQHDQPEEHGDDVAERFGAGDDIEQKYETADADSHHFELYLANTSRHFFITADTNVDWGLTSTATPTLVLQNEDQTDVTKRIMLSHDGTNGVIDVGTGVVSIPDGITSAGAIEMTQSTFDDVDWQFPATGTASQPAVFIDDNRTGATANHEDESTIVIDAEGSYALYILDGAFRMQSGQTAYFEGQVNHYNNVAQTDNYWFLYGAGSDFGMMWDTNGTGDDLIHFYTSPAASDSDCYFFSHSNTPNNMTDHDNYMSPTLVLTNQQGADANDYAGVVIGERANADVSAVHYFDLYAMTGSVDGSTDATTTEIAATFRIGDSGSATTGHSLSSGDVLFEDDIEVDGTAYFDGAVTIVAGNLADDTVQAADIDTLNAGAYATWDATNDEVDVDVETVTDTKCWYWEDPVATDDFQTVYYAEKALTITRIFCESDQTVTMTCQEDDGSPADIETTDQTCDSTPHDQTTGFEDASIAAGSRIDFAVASVSGTPTWCSYCISYTYDD